MSVRPLSTMARRMLRPMRPNPLIATFTVIVFAPFLESSKSVRASQIMRSEDLLDDRLGGDAEVPVEILIGRARAKSGHADEDSVGSDDRIPAEAHGGLDRDLDRRIADDAGTDVLGLSQEEVERGHRYNAN